MTAGTAHPPSCSVYCRKSCFCERPKRYRDIVYHELSLMYMYNTLGRGIIHLEEVLYNHVMEHCVLINVKFEADAEAVPSSIYCRS